MKEDITKLTNIWYKLVSLDHHKDRDCHWYINTVYSYGEPPVYRVEHYGYVGGELSGEYDSYKRAESALEGMLRVAIHEEKEWAKGVLSSKEKWEQYQIERATNILAL